MYPRVQVATGSLESTGQRASSGERHNEHPEIQEVVSDHRAKTSLISKHWNQRETTPRPTEPTTAAISKTKNKHPEIQEASSDHRVNESTSQDEQYQQSMLAHCSTGSRVIKIWWDEHTITELATRIS